MSQLRQVYETVCHACDGREGKVWSDDGHLKQEIDLIKAVGGKGEKSNPEQLFAAGYAACFSSIALYTTKRFKLNVPELPVGVKVKLFNQEDNVFAFSLKVEISATIPGVSDEDAVRVMKEAHRNCAYSNIVKPGVVEKLTVNGIDIPVHE
ncbi:Ohr family peroxiredoxin [Mycoplasmopsis alligatoris]|uniref:Peroxiredoxin, Ohr family protein n=1 Tax=Mycoplasmopsis alligatoris A21JP2 TaxID=747682 RepID=D4XUW0_9BACT|nr:Ohr family peroxiredoxin [Mycoplasmopsis alligatoris]EFF41867.1 peroxiredoxin, Ohr family protein [Mycoplasmopsis alligatoris A21JP2]